MAGTNAEIFKEALRHHQGGDLARAKALYREILERDSGHVEALHLLGLLKHQVGDSKGALPLMRQAIALHPGAALFHSNLGIVLLDQGLLEEATENFREAVRLKPGYVDALRNLGLALKEQGQLREAAACCRQALAGNPRHASALNILGMVLKEDGQLAAAAACFREALDVDPAMAAAHSNLAIALARQGHADEAEAGFQEALRLGPGQASAHYNFGIFLADQGRLEEARACYRQALQLAPGHVNAHINLGNVLREQRQLPEALACYREALRLSPGEVDAHINMAEALKDQQQFGAALEQYERALELNPGHEMALLHRGMLRLLTGDFERGWADYERRFKHADAVPRAVGQPRWDGAPLHGKTILLYAEQGLGDTLQFVRYAPLVRARGGIVVCECPAALASLLAGGAGIDHVVAAGAALPPFDVQAPLLSLPGILGTTLKSVPASMPYLHAPESLVEAWRQELAPFSGFRIGVAWQGNPKFKGDRERSIALSQFESLARVPGVQLVSVQKGPGAEQVRSPELRFPVVDLNDRLDSFLATAAVVMNLDLIVTVDSVVAHLAGGLGARVWTLLPANPDWRWLLDRSDSPWYPTMRLFRQKILGDWSEVVGRVALEVRQMVENRVY